MSAFRLQTFSPRAEADREAAAKAAPKPATILESAHIETLALAREAAFREGYLAAQAEVTDAFLDDRTRLTSALIETLNDARLTNEAARRHVLASLAPTVEALCEAIAPSLAEAGFGPEIAARVERALAAAPEARPRLRCAPELAPTLEALLAERGLPAEVEASPELLPREAELHWAEGFDRIDIDACVAEIRACLASHLNPARAAGDPEDADRG